MPLLSPEAIRVINIAVLSICSVELAVLLLSFPRDRLKNRASNILHTKMLVSMFTTLSYALSLLKDLQNAVLLTTLLRALAYVGIYAVYVLYIMYISEHINISDHSKKVPAWVINLSVVAGIVGAVLWVLSLFSPSFRDLSDPGLEYGRMFALGHAGGFVMVMISILILIAYRNTLGFRETLVLASMPVLISIASLSEPFLQGIELRYPAIVVEFLIVYTQHHLELEAKQEIGETEGLRQRLNIAADRMKPHYLYNVLTTIYYLCETDPSRAQHAIGIFSEYMKSTLEAMEKQELVDFTWEIHEIRNYLVLEKLRFGDKLNVIYDLEYDDFKLPPLTIQPFVENAVKHGIGGKEEGGTIRIVSRKLSDGGVQIRVKDDGAGFDITSIAGQDYMQEGIANVRERLRLEVGGDVTITSSVGKGTTVMVTIRNPGD